MQNGRRAGSAQTNRGSLTERILPFLPAIFCRVGEVQGRDRRVQAHRSVGQEQRRRRHQAARHPRRTTRQRGRCSEQAPEHRRRPRELLPTGVRSGPGRHVDASPFRVGQDLFLAGHRTPRAPTPAVGVPPAVGVVDEARDAKPHPRVTRPAKPRLQRRDEVHREGQQESI